MKKYLIYIIVLVISSTLLIGCGGSDSYVIIDNADKPVADTVTVTGSIADGTNQSARASEMRYSLGGSLAGVRVYVEDHNDLFGITDDNGRFVIEKVPLGIKSFIAEKKEMDSIAFRQRLASINVTANEKEVYEIKTPIKMVASPYFLKYIMTDASTGKAITNATITAWGTDYSSDAKGEVTISNFPEGSDVVATIKASGYRSVSIKLSFGKNINSVGEIKMSQVGISNIPPVIAIKYIDDSSAITSDDDKKLYLAANKYITLEGIGCDLDDPDAALTWDWSTTNGQFSGNTNNQKIQFMITEENTNVIITLTAKDKDNAESKAVLEFNPNGKSSEKDIEFIEEYRASATGDGKIFLVTQSGVIIDAREETFAENVVVGLMEYKNFECVDGAFTSVSSLFTLVAEKELLNPLGVIKNKVISTEKPVYITVPNNNAKNVDYYVGTRTNSNCPWKYIAIDDEKITIDARYAFGVPAQFVFITYNVDFQFAIFVKADESQD